jgi:ABC-2 type transport system ATP-binding protein
MNEALQLEALTKRYGQHTAVADLSLSVPTGTIYGILGPNGAGKTTTLRMIMNILLPDSGSIRLLGSDPTSDRKVLNRVGYLPEERGLHRKMKVLDVIVFFAQLKGMDAKTAAREAGVWLERMGLADRAQSKVETLSKGMQQKVQFIATVLHRPDVLILDEPQSGLDPVNQEVLRDTILEARREGRTVVLSTHNMSEAEAMCEHICIIANGRKILDGLVHEVRRAHRGNRYSVEFDFPSNLVAQFIETTPLLAKRTRHGTVWEIEPRVGVDSRRLVTELASLDAPLTRFEHVEPSLHEIFVQRVGEANAAEMGVRTHA